MSINNSSMNKDIHLIWEQFEKRAKNQQHNKLITESVNTSVLQEQYTSQIVEQILIDEGLMDTIKGAGKSAIQNIGSTINNKVLQPIIQKAVDWLKQNDPDALVQLATATQDGPEAVDQIISQQGGDQIEQEIVNSSSETVTESSDMYREIVREHIIYLHNEGLLGNIAKGIGSGVTKASKGLQNLKTKGQQAVKDMKQGYAQGVASANAPADKAGSAPVSEPSSTGGTGNGAISKIINWVKENPNMSKGIAMGIMGAASVALGAAFTSVLATAATGYAIGGGIKGIPAYLQLRKQGVEPMEAIKQAAKTAHNAAMNTATIATGGQLIGNVADKLSGGGGAAPEAPAPEAPAQPASIRDQMDDWVPGKVTRSPDGSIRVSGGYSPSQLDDFEESVLPKPGWVNKKIN